MSTNETKSRFAWISTAVEAAGFVIFCTFIGVGISLACVTAAETVVDTRNTARKVVELQKRLDVLEAQTHVKQALATSDAAVAGIGERQTAKDSQR